MGLVSLLKGVSRFSETIPGRCLPRPTDAWWVSRLRGDPAHGLTMRKMRATRESIVEMQRCLEDDHLDEVSGLALFGPADAGDLPDNLHPTDAGNKRIAERFAMIAVGAGGPLPPDVG
jgi:hypothetical protein